MIDILVIGLILVAVAFAIKKSKKTKGSSACSGCHLSGNCASEKR